MPTKNYGGSHSGPQPKAIRRLCYRLRTWRKGAGLSQTDAAKLMHVDQSTWSDWECATAVPVRLESLLLLELHVGIPIESWLVSARARRAAEAVFESRVARAKQSDRASVATVATSTAACETTKQEASR